MREGKAGMSRPSIEAPRIGDSRQFKSAPLHLAVAQSSPDACTGSLTSLPTQAVVVYQPHVRPESTPSEMIPLSKPIRHAREGQGVFPPVVTAFDSRTWHVPQLPCWSVRHDEEPNPRNGYLPCSDRVRMRRAYRAPRAR